MKPTYYTYDPATRTVTAHSALTPEVAAHFEEWDKRTIAVTGVVDPVTGEDVHVSTVFLVIDHNWMGSPPVLFETMVFGGRLDGEQERYCTVDEAEAGHKEVVNKALLTGAEDPDDE